MQKINERHFTFCYAWIAFTIFVVCHNVPTSQFYYRYQKLCRSLRRLAFCYLSKQLLFNKKVLCISVLCSLLIINKTWTLSYITPSFYGPGNEGVSMVDFVKAYKAENPGAESAEIVVNLFRWNERPWVEEDFSFIKNHGFSVKRFLKKQFLKNKSYYRGVIDSLVVCGSVLLASHFVYKHE